MNDTSQVTDETDTRETDTRETVTGESVTDETVTDETVTDETATNETVTGESDAESARRAVSAQVLMTLLTHYDGFRGYLERRLRDRALAEDVLHDVFMRAMTAAAGLRDERAATVWFQRTLRNAVVDVGRRGASRRRAHDAAARDGVTEAEPTERTTTVCRCVAHEASSLGETLSFALRRVDVEGASIEALAKETGITRNNARVRLFRARSALRSRVRASCGACSEGGCTDCSCATRDAERAVAAPTEAEARSGRSPWWVLGLT